MSAVAWDATAVARGGETHRDRPARARPAVRFHHLLLSANQRNEHHQPGYLRRCDWYGGPDSGALPLEGPDFRQNDKADIRGGHGPFHPHRFCHSFLDSLHRPSGVLPSLRSARDNNSWDIHADGKLEKKREREKERKKNPAPFLFPVPHRSEAA